MGHDVQIANDGESALEIISGWQPVVVLLDIGMPKMNGYEVAFRVREKAECDGTLLVALTGWGQSDDRRRTDEAGFDHHLVKPVDIQDLRKILTTVNAPRTMHQ